MMKDRSGYTALVSTIIIAAILAIIAFASSYGVFLARVDIMEAEFKLKSEKLAETCVDIAIQRIAENPDYAVTNEAVSIGSDSCTIVLVDSSDPSYGIIYAQAIYKEAYTNYSVKVDKSDLAVSFWKEIANL